MNALKKIFRSEVVCMLMLTVFFQPAYFAAQIPQIDMALNVLKLGGFLLMAVLFFTDIRRHMQKTFNWILLLLWFELFVSTLLSENASIYRFAHDFSNILVIVFFIEEMAIRNPYKGLESLYIYFSACILINTLTVFVFPNGMYANSRGLWVCWFLGEDNVGYLFYIAASTIALLYCHYIARKTTFNSMLIWANSLVFVFYRNIVTGIICQLLWLILVFGLQFHWFKKLLDATYSLYLTVAGFVFVILTRKLLIVPIITKLHRNADLGRGIVWSRVLKAVPRRLFLGYGVYEGEMFNRFFSISLYSSHNYLLQLLFWGGICAAILFCIQLLCANSCAAKIHDKFIYQCMTVGLIVLSVRYWVEVDNMQVFYMFLALLAYGKEFLESLEHETELKRTAQIQVRSLPKIRLSFVKKGKCV